MRLLKTLSFITLILASEHVKSQWEYLTSVKFDGEVKTLRVLNQNGNEIVVLALTDHNDSTSQIESFNLGSYSKDAKSYQFKSDNIVLGKRIVENNNSTSPSSDLIYTNLRENFKLSLSNYKKELFVNYIENKKEYITRYYLDSKYDESKMNTIGYEWINYNKFFPISFDIGNKDYQNAKWTNGLSVLYYQDRLELHQITEKKRQSSTIDKITKRRDFPKNIFTNLVDVIDINNFFSSSELGDKISIVCAYDTSRNTIRTVICGEDCYEINEIKLSNGDSDWKPAWLDLSEWNNACLTIVDQLGKLHCFRLVDKRGWSANTNNPKLLDINYSQWAEFSTQPNIIDLNYAFEAIEDSKDAIIVRIDPRDKKPFYSLLTESTIGDVYEYDWIDKIFGKITDVPVNQVAMSSSKKYYGVELIVACSLDEDRKTVRLYRATDYVKDPRIGRLLQRRQLLLDASDIYDVTMEYKWAKEVAQLSESLSDYDLAEHYYGLCLSVLNKDDDKDEYSYINAHLITCKFLEQTIPKEKNLSDNNKSVVTSQASIDPKANAVSLDEEIESKSVQSRSWLKQFAQKIQKEQKIRESVEATRKVNMALALINQWQDEIVPRENFEFIDEQLGVLTNLIALIQGHQLSVNMEGGKLSFGDSRFNKLLDNVEAIKQLQNLEGQEFSKEELEAVTLEEVEVKDGVTFSSSPAMDSPENYNGTYDCFELINRPKGLICGHVLVGNGTGQLQLVPKDCNWHVTIQNSYTKQESKYCKPTITIAGDILTFREESAYKGVSYINSNVNTEHVTVVEGKCQLINGECQLSLTAKTNPGAHVSKRPPLEVKLLPDSKIRIYGPSNKSGTIVIKQ